jgi:hypothetical protein
MDARKKFKWNLFQKYGSKGPYYWESDVIRLKNLGFHESVRPKAFASYTSRHSGPNTAYASFTVLFDHFPKSKFGFTLTKHFSGPNAHLKARSWCDWLLNNCPDYSHQLRFRGENCVI